MEESEIGNKIKSELHINVAKHLKLTRCCSSLIRSIAFFVFATEDSKQKNYLQCGSNLYYSAFHLASSVLFLEKQNQMPLSEYMLDKNTDSKTNQKRIFRIPHTELPKQIPELKDHKEYREKLIKSLENLIELRKLNSYGPYFQLIDDEEISEKNIGFSYRFVPLKTHFDTFGKGIGHTEIYKICEKEKENLDELIDDFIKLFVQRSSKFGNYQMSLLMYALPALIPAILTPLANKSMLKDIEFRVKQIAVLVGGEKKKLYDRTKKKCFDAGCENNEKGDLQSQVRIGLSRKRTIHPSNF